MCWSYMGPCLELSASVFSNVIISLLPCVSWIIVVLIFEVVTGGPHVFIIIIYWFIINFSTFRLSTFASYIGWYECHFNSTVIFNYVFSYSCNNIIIIVVVIYCCSCCLSYGSSIRVPKSIDINIGIGICAPLFYYYSFADCNFTSYCYCRCHINIKILSVYYYCYIYIWWVRVARQWIAVLYLC